MPAGTHQSRRWDGRPRRRSPRGGGALGPYAGDRRRVGERAWGACRAPARGGPRRWGAPRPGVCLARGAGPEVREDLVDHRRLGNERDDPHGAMAGRTYQRVDHDNLLEQGRPPATGLGRRESWRGDDVGQRRGGGLALTPHPARAVGIPAIIPRRDMPFVRDMEQHPRQKRQRVGGPTARSCSPVSVRMAAVTVRAATRAISPSRRRR